MTNDFDSVPTIDGIPAIGLGTYQNTDHEECAESVRTALEVGYRHVDTAQWYDNEDAVGDGLAAADVPREDVFLATKVWNSNLGGEDVHRTTRESMEKLGVDSLDMLYVHWPAEAYEPEETLAAFTDLYEEGLIERVAVSNFTPELLEEAIEVCEAPIVANQVEMHPLLPQEELREVCDRHDVTVVAYTPIARGKVMEVPEIQTVAEKHGVSEVQVTLAWLREKGVVAIPKATGRDHIEENLASLEVDLEAEDVALIDSIERRERIVDPGFAAW